MWQKYTAYHQQQTFKLPADVTDGIMIEHVVPSSPAERAGLQELDVITALDGEECLRCAGVT